MLPTHFKSREAKDASLCSDPLLWLVRGQLTDQKLPLRHRFLLFSLNATYKMKTQTQRKVLSCKGSHFNDN